MSARQAFNNIARRRLVPPNPRKSYVKWYMNWADTAHKAVVLTCVGVTLYYGVGVVYMFIQSRKNKGELRKKLIEAGVIDEDGRQLLHRLKDEDSWLGTTGVQKREHLAEKIEDKKVTAALAAKKAEEEQLRLEQENVDRTRVGVFDPPAEVVERNRRRREEMARTEDEASLDPRVGVFYRDKGEGRRGQGWFEWVWGKTGEERQVEAAAASASAVALEGESQGKDVKS